MKFEMESFVMGNVNKYNCAGLFRADCDVSIVIQTAYEFAPS